MNNKIGARLCMLYNSNHLCSIQSKLACPEPGIIAGIKEKN